MTKQRELILRIIGQAEEHLTAEQVYVRAKEQMPSIAIATVYRNLNLMVQAGEIRRVPVLNAPDRFDKKILPHDHLICGKCGRLFDIEIPGLSALLEEQIQSPVEAYELNIHFTCPDCRGSK